MSVASGGSGEPARAGGAAADRAWRGDSGIAQNYIDINIDVKRPEHRANIRAPLEYKGQQSPVSFCSETFSRWRRHVEDASRGTFADRLGGLYVEPQAAVRFAFELAVAGVDVYNAVDEQTGRPQHDHAVHDDGAAARAPHDVDAPRLGEKCRQSADQPLA
jgi:hypothetical protein